MYEAADKVKKRAKSKFIILFENQRSILSFDKVNVLHEAKTLYDELDRYTKKALLKIARAAYDDYLTYWLLSENEEDGKSGKKKKRKFTEEWLLEWLGEVNPALKYIYLNEVERKRGRYAESVDADLESGKNPEKELKTALRWWSQMFNQLAIDVTDEANLQALKDYGVKKVRWVTEKDEKVCGVCDSYDEKIFDIDKVPDKPHINCRCYIVPVKDDIDRKRT